MKIENILYSKNIKKFNNIKTEAELFSVKYNGDNIIQDDIFYIIKNYAKKNDIQIEVMKIPIKDDLVWAFTTLRKGVIFIVINSHLPLNKQIFSAAHELYHIICYERNYDNCLLNGSILLANEQYNAEDNEANAFASLLLVPSKTLFSQLSIQSIDIKENIKLLDIITLMEVFAVPYKAIVLRLYEENYINNTKVNKLLEKESIEIYNLCELNNLSTRWIKRSDEIDLAALDKIINENIDVLGYNRIKEDQDELNDIYKILDLV